MRHKARTLFILGLSCAAVSQSAACSAPRTDDPHKEALGTSSAASKTAFANDQTAYDYFRTKGFTNFQAAAIVGNLDQESGIDPNISQQNGGPGRGIAQWSAGGRWDSDQGDNVVAFATQKGQSPYSLSLQLDFIMYELQTFPNYGLAKLKASTNVNDATVDFELDFEGCGIPSQCDGASRISYAQSILNAYGNDPVNDDAGQDDTGAPPEDAATTSEGGEPEDGGAPNPSDAGGNVADASPPVQRGDASAPPAGSSAPPATSGCAIATASAGRDAGLDMMGGAWLAALGLVLAITRRRAGSRSQIK
jgi:hypothetical protein